MIIMAIADTHGHTAALAALSAHLAHADVVFLAGDLTQFGHADEAARVMEAVRAANPNVLAVSGNCDYPDVTSYLAEEGIGLHATHVVRDGVAFLGVGGSLPCPGHTPNEFSEKELAAFLAEAAEGLTRDLPWVLVSHQPPRDTEVDRVRSGMHVGSRAVRDFIAEFEPLACFTGHIHEAAGMDAIGPTRIVNPGPLRNGHYAYAEVSRTLSVLEIRGA